MSFKKPGRNQINILQNCTVKTSNKSNCETVVFPEKHHENHLTQQLESTNKENGFNSNFTVAWNDPNSKGRRYTTSMCIFDEEPFFSDSDEEKEYNREILKLHNLVPSEFPENVSLEDQCNLTSCEKEIINVIKKCSSVDIENCDGDFKKFVSLCRHLVNKYPLPDTQEDDVSGDNSTKNSTYQQLPETSLSNLKFRNISAEFLPSRHGSDDFVSESFTSRNNLCTSTTLRPCTTPIKAVSKENSLKLNNIDINLNTDLQEKSSILLRRPSRLLRTTRFNKSGVKIKTRLNKSKKKNTNKPIKSGILKPTKTASEKLTTVHSKRKKVKDKEASVLDVISNDSSASGINKNQGSTSSNFLTKGQEEKSREYVFSQFCLFRNYKRLGDVETRYM